MAVPRRGGIAKRNNRDLRGCRTSGIGVNRRSSDLRLFEAKISASELRILQSSI